jgi:pSer/pThr/pTyr-binding forkhead associated (FHA) protein
MITKNVFKIGKANRGVDYTVSGNGAISRQHAIITKKDDGYYIKDNKSTNHTYVNNVQLEDDQELMLTDNCRITFGDEDFIFKLR